jgi:hypothetical protein
MRFKSGHFDPDTILALNDWLGHDFESDGVCGYCEKSALELSKKSGIPLCDNGEESKAIDRAMRL